VEKNAVLVSVSGMVERSRMVKDDDEIAALTQACLITDRAWETTISEGVIGKTESEIAGIVEMYFRKFGAEDRAFESIVASGPHSAIPHHHPTDRVIQRGDFLKMDIGAKFAGYHADMTRTVVIGSAADWQREIYDWVKLAQQTAMNACVPGADVFPINGIGHGVVADAGYGDKLVHQIGHGVGLEIHEKPFLGRQDGILRPRMPITVEPGIYLEGRGGVRIEDTILITDSGYRRLTESTRDLLEI
jgi:Xaa-Pro aminopeptidase